MPTIPIAILNVGLVTSLGQTATATCAALRAGISNVTQTKFMGDDGEWVMAHQVELERAWRGLDKLARMAVLAAGECLADGAAAPAEQIPLLLCIVEAERPGRAEGIDEQLFPLVEAGLGLRFHPQHSAVIPAGRTGAFIALAQARKLIQEYGAPQVLIVASDSLVSWPTLQAYARERRLLARRNSNGFIAGEGAGALLVGQARAAPDEMLCTGIGMGREPATVLSTDPLRAEGLTAAVKAALAEAGRDMRDIEVRISDLSGEQYFFKEASLALSRTLRNGRGMVDIWHPASGIGETGAVAGAAVVVNAWMALRKGYAIGSTLLLHGSADGYHRAAAVVRSGGGHG